LNEYKTTYGCRDCGYDENPAAMDFDHVTGVKLFTVSSGVTRSWEILLAEIEKCEVVCANCHRIRTDNRRTA